MVAVKIGENRVALAAAICAVAGIALLLFLSETPQKYSVARALAASPNTLVEITGRAKNVTDGKFALCELLCISVKSNSLPSGKLAADGKWMTVLGRVKEYQGNRYLDAEKIEIRLDFEE